MTLRDWLLATFGWLFCMFGGNLGPNGDSNGGGCRCGRPHPPVIFGRDWYHVPPIGPGRAYTRDDEMPGGQKREEERQWR